MTIVVAACDVSTGRITFIRKKNRKSLCFGYWRFSSVLTHARVTFGQQLVRMKAACYTEIMVYYAEYQSRGEGNGMKKFFSEFKEFALKGSVVDMAVGVIIGGAFTKSSLHWWQILLRRLSVCHR